MDGQELSVFMDWMGQTHHVGELTAFTSRGSEHYQFRYASAWVERRDCFAIDPALELVPDLSYSAQELWGVFQDVSPDRWGCLIQTRIQNRFLSRCEFMLGVSDYMRMGALRLTARGQPNAYLAAHSDVPKLVHLAEIERASRHIENNKATPDDLAILLQPGTSLGGAHPKAAIEDEGTLWIAKFQSVMDTERVALLEATMLDLAAYAGIETPEHRVLNGSGKRPILLIKRFDRLSGARVPFLSAMTLLERNEKNKDNASYLELADGITRFSSQPRRDKNELWRRMVFNAMMGNIDDHLRNHAFLRDVHGWHLSPVYDLNPTSQPAHRRSHALSFDGQRSQPSLDGCLELAPYFEVEREQITAVLRQLQLTLRAWQAVAKRNGLKPAEIKRLAVSFEHDDTKRILGGL